MIEALISGSAATCRRRPDELLGRVGHTGERHAAVAAEALLRLHLDAAPVAEHGSNAKRPRTPVARRLRPDVTISADSSIVTGRFAPSPTGELHLGNLRTALVAWLAARSTGGGFIVRMEDLDRVTSSVEHERRQLADLAAIGLDWDGDVVRQSERFERYREAIEVLDARGPRLPVLLHPARDPSRDRGRGERAPRRAAARRISGDMSRPHDARSGRRARRSGDRPRCGCAPSTSRSRSSI